MSVVLVPAVSSICQPTHRMAATGWLSCSSCWWQPASCWLGFDHLWGRHSPLPVQIPDRSAICCWQWPRLSCTAQESQHAAHTQLPPTCRLSCSCLWQPALCCWLWARLATCLLNRPAAPTPRTKLARMSPTHPAMWLSRFHMASALSRTLAPVSSAHCCTCNASRCLWSGPGVLDCL